MAVTKDNTEYFEKLNIKLKQLFCISFDDTGYTKEEWISRFGDLTLDNAVSEYGRKYDLTAKAGLFKLKKGQQLLPQTLV